MPAPVALTGRLVVLEPLAPHHAQGLAEASAGDSCHSFTPRPRGVRAARFYIAAALEQQETGTVLPFAVIRRTDNRIVGSTRFLAMDYWQGPLTWPPAPRGPLGDHHTAAPDAAEIGGTWLCPDARGTGVNTEAKLLMLGHAFDIWQVRRISMRADARNARSRTAIERLGAVSEGIRRAHSRGLDGQIRDTAFYSILREDWPTVQEGIERRLTRTIKTATSSRATWSSSPNAAAATVGSVLRHPHLSG
ncbi:N-acetyltransferase [Streptomyces spinoverrucosus]|uniref:N-acetyltransferase n=1 Tax=Streptomyces spinoverrucosus TaxID=284043 RepID=A0A4Y3VXZ0_9ACTN|nr:GNAT family protein [Streptomyces spinoverrucosus]GEC10539.1 N-acetyltransferase [Streptomyces spinoverrucosus]GHB98860.1 N-acetyltransferase [Streptomyces spinoverrucosus]